MYGNSFLALCRGFDRSDVDDLFGFRISDALKTEDKHSENDKDNSENRDWFHDEEGLHAEDQTPPVANSFRLSDLESGFSTPEARRRSRGGLKMIMVVV